MAVLYLLLVHQNNNNIIIISGESGLVYKGYLDTAIGKELVAVKTGKGKVYEK